MDKVLKDARKYQMMPDMLPYQFEALKADIEERGVLTPIDIDENGSILDGHHRYRACKELGITDYPTVIRIGLTEPEKRLFARKSNMMRRHLTRKQMREIIKGQLKETSMWANNRIAKELGVDGKTVKTIRKQLESTSEIPKLTKLEGADGKVRKDKKPSIMVSNESEKDELLRRLKESGVDISSLPNEFLSAVNANLVFTGKHFKGRILEDLSEEQQRQWTAFCSYLEKKCGYDREGVGLHVEWLIARFEDLQDLFSESADRWFKSYGMHGYSAKLKEAILHYTESFTVEDMRKLMN